MTDANAASEQHPLHNGFKVVRNGVAIQTGHIERVVSREQISIARNGERTLIVVETRG